MPKKMEPTQLAKLCQMFSGQTWVFTPLRNSGSQWGLGVAVENGDAHYRVPLEFCRGESLHEMRDYADRLNARRNFDPASAARIAESCAALDASETDPAYGPRPA